MKRRSGSELIKKILEFIRKEKLLKEGDRVLVALSGGMDSVALLHILLELSKKLGISIAAAHLNHMLRESAYRDERFVEKLCGDLGVEIYVERIDVKKIWKRSGKSLEEVARDVRYSFLWRIKERVSASKIATAHHMDDLLETILYRLVRGTGPFGLIGMKPSSGDIIRPFLCVRREEIKRYVEEKNLEYVVDETNFDTSIPRNFIRHGIVPLLERLNPNVSFSIFRLSRILSQMRDFLIPILNDLYSKSSRKLTGRLEFKIPDNVYVISEFVRMASLELSGKVPEWVKVESFIEGLNKTSHKVVFWEDFGAWKSFDRFIVGRLKPLKIDSKVEFGELRLGEFVLNVERGSGGDFSTFLKPDEMAFRARKKGDKIGRRKLKDILIDKKIPTYFRDEIPILVHGNEIIWIPGIWKNRRFEGEGVRFKVVKSPIEM